MEIIVAGAGAEIRAFLFFTTGMNEARGHSLVPLGLRNIWSAKESNHQITFLSRYGLQLLTEIFFFHHAIELVRIPVRILENSPQLFKFNIRLLDYLFKNLVN